MLREALLVPEAACAMLRHEPVKAPTDSVMTPRKVVGRDAPLRAVIEVNGVIWEVSRIFCPQRARIRLVLTAPPLSSLFEIVIPLPSGVATGDSDLGAKGGGCMTSTGISCQRYRARPVGALRST